MADIDGGDILFTFRGDASQLQAEIELTSSSLDQVSDDADSAGGSLRGLSSITRMASAELGRGTVAVVGLTRGVAGLKLALGPAVLVVAAVTAAMKLYQQAVDRAAESAERAQSQIEGFNDAFDNQAVIAEVLREELRLISGEIDKDGLAHEKRKIRIQAAGDALVSSIDDQIEAQEALIKSTEMNTRVSDDQQAGIGVLTKELSLLNQERADAVEATESQIVAAAAIAEYNREAKESEEALTISTKNQAAAAREAAAAEADRVAGISAGVAQITADANAAAAEVSAGMDQVVADMDAVAGVMQQTIAADQAAIEGGISDTLTGVSQLSGTLSEKMAEDNKKAAIALFRTSQAAALGNVAMNTGVAIVRTLAELGPIAGPIASIGIGALGAAQAAAIASQAPPAHMGDPLAPDERSVSGRRVLATEAVLDSATTRRMGGEDGLRQAMRGGDSSEPVQVNLTYKHLDREVARLMRNNSRTRRTLARLIPRR